MRGISWALAMIRLSTKLPYLRHNRSLPNQDSYLSSYSVISTIMAVKALMKGFPHICVAFGVLGVFLLLQFKIFWPMDSIGLVCISPMVDLAVDNLDDDVSVLWCLPFSFSL